MVESGAEDDGEGEESEGEEEGGDVGDATLNDDEEGFCGEELSSDGSDVDDEKDENGNCKGFVVPDDYEEYEERSDSDEEGSRKSRRKKRRRLKRRRGEPDRGFALRSSRSPSHSRSRSISMPPSAGSNTSVRGVGRKRIADLSDDSAESSECESGGDSEEESGSSDRARVEAKVAKGRRKRRKVISDGEGGDEGETEDASDTARRQTSATFRARALQAIEQSADSRNEQVAKLVEMLLEQKTMIENLDKMVSDAMQQGIKLLQNEA